jgi:hypothetical protein
MSSVNSTGPISIGGGYFSMGQQTASAGSLHLNMSLMNTILSIHDNIVCVQSGATWRQVQEAIDPFNLSVAIMQSYASFTVGGSLSVNAHGRYLGRGPLITSVDSFRIVVASGELFVTAPSFNEDIFYGAIGGYGGLGAIVDACLDLETNSRLERDATRMHLSEYRNYFFRHVEKNSTNVVLHNADILPPYWDHVISVNWQHTNMDLTVQEQCHATASQVQQAYPGIKTLLALKADLDPASKFHFGCPAWRDIF